MTDEEKAEQINLKELAKKLDVDGLINDESREVIVLMDDALIGSGRVNFHPNMNAMTLGIDYGDFEKFLAWCGNNVRYCSMD